MKLTDNIYFYEGDSRLQYVSARELYKGVGSSNFLVLKDGNTQVMIDSGFHVGPHLKRMQREMDEDEIDINNTSTVIFSHAHPDHIQQAKSLAKQKKLRFIMHKGNELFIRSNDFYFEAYYNYPKHIRNEIMLLPKPLTKMTFRLLGFDFGYLTADEFWDNNQTLNLCNGIEVIELPGHCSGHVGFYFIQQKILYAADLIYEANGRYNILPCINNALSSLQCGINDICSASKLDIDIYIPGHGKIIYGKENINNFLNQSVENMHNLMAEIVLYLKNKKHSTLSDITNSFFDKRYLCNYVHVISIIYNTLQYLIKQKRVSFTVKNNRARWYAL